MRTLIIVTMLFSVSVFSQSRVRENIKQRSIQTSEDSEKDSGEARAVRDVKAVKASSKTRR